MRVPVFSTTSPAITVSYLRLVAGSLRRHGLRKRRGPGSGAGFSESSNPLVDAAAAASSRPYPFARSMTAGKSTRTSGISTPYSLPASGLMRDLCRGDGGFCGRAAEVHARTAEVLALRERDLFSFGRERVGQRDARLPAADYKDIASTVLHLSASLTAHPARVRFAPILPPANGVGVWLITPALWLGSFC